MTSPRRLTLLTLLATTVVTTCARADEPGMFLSPTEIAEIRSRIDAGDEPWASVFAALYADATAALRMDPRPIEGRFRYTAPIGHAADEADLPHPDRLRRDSHIVRDLGLVYALTGEEQFASKAVEFVSAWVSSMEPSWPFDRPGPGVEAFDSTLPAMFYGYDLIAGSAPRTPEFAQAVAAWAGTIAEECKLRHYTTGTADTTGWNMLLIASASVVANKPQDRNFVWGDTENEDTFQSMLYLLFDSSGKVDARASAGSRYQGEDVFVAIRRLKTYVYVAEIARHHGVDLYNWQRDGRGLRSSLTAYAPYFTGEISLPGVGGFPLGRDADAWVYEIAHTTWPDRMFQEAIQYLGRPGFDMDILGPVGLTHRYRGGGEAAERP